MNTTMPLASRMRPRCLSEFLGQQHLLGPGKPLAQSVAQGRLHSMILWGPPGSGKTTLAHLLANSVKANAEKISAVLSGVKDIRDIVERAKKTKQATVLFVDEVHRFNKAQQDAFLPHIEDGTLILIGATTENPSFQLNNALLSRARVYVLKPLEKRELALILEQAIQDTERGLGAAALTLSDDLKQRILHYADGDARQCLNLLELIGDFVDVDNGCMAVDEAAIETIFRQSLRRFDHHGDIYYEQISALHKSVRGSNPDAALYWFSRMIEGGCDPAYLARRLVRMASEDIGNADPRALTLTLHAWQAYERLGTPEGELALAQAVVYLAVAAKSNAIYTALGAAMKDAKEQGSQAVPMHLRNAPTKLMKQLDYGKDYRYAHNEKDAFAAAEKYFPENMGEREYYFPVERGLEIKIKEKLQDLRERNACHSKKL